MFNADANKLVVVVADKISNFFNDETKFLCQMI